MIAHDNATILLENGEIIAVQAYPGEQHVIRIRAPRIAEAARAGHFIHLRCSAELLMRRPMSIMRVNPAEGWLEILFKVHGAGTGLLSRRQIGESVSLLGPIGKPFKQSDYRRRTLLIGGGVGIPPMVFLAEHLHAQGGNPFVVMGSEVPFPFTPKPSRILVNGIPSAAIASMPLLEDWGIASRLASRETFPGCFDGYVTELAEHWITAQTADHDAAIEIFACGPTPMLKAVAALAERHQLPCEISVEEYMACAVGGCAGCAIAVRTPNGIAMQRVCVDGPVFESRTVVFA